MSGEQEQEPMRDRELAATIREKLNVATNEEALAHLEPYFAGLAKPESIPDPNDA